ncbi:hypothetical protein ACFY20_45175 [Streptomyces sp. NPDC001312]|uniref:hypothetical protein n=1 Tax=Streptomyces sp. NPDC001312 TaxID=3364561 RepID=UPI00368C10E5
MIMNRSHATVAAVAAAAALAATGITYATAAPAPQTAPAVAQQAPAPAYAPMGGEGGQGKGNEGGGRGGQGGERGEGGEGFKGFKGKRHHREIGRIFINERSFSAHPDGCITVVSGLGSKSFNIRNDSKQTVEFFRGVTCDNGAPIATVGPRSEANNVRPGKIRDEDEDEKGEHHKKHHEEMEDGVRVKNGVVGSFRVIKRHHGKGEFGEFGEGEFGGFDED